MLNFDEVKKYWNERARSDSSAQSTTQDVFLREIEVRALTEVLQRLSLRTVADFGCGDGRTTARLAQAFPGVSFTGFDYAPAMIENASSLHRACPNLRFELGDVTTTCDKRVDAAYTTRCLINLPSWEMQQQALKNIARALNAGGHYVMIENFVEGHENFNTIRASFGLPRIEIRPHNNFFREERLLEFIAPLLTVERSVNISSTYYLVSRVIYSKICEQTGQTPDYFDDHHRLAAELPFAGEFGPVRLLVLKKASHG